MDQLKTIVELPELDEREFKDLREHLSKHNIPINKYRKGVGDGRSQCFGMVRKRSMAPDLSRNSWMDPRLHYLLMRFAREHVEIPFTSVQVNDNYLCAKHMDKHNVGESYIVGFGDYTGGELVLEGKELNIRHRPILFDGSKIEHSTKEFKGRRWTIVYHTLEAPKKFPMIRQLSDYEAGCKDGEYVIAWHKDGEPTEYLSKKNGLPHPLKGRKVKDHPKQMKGKNTRLTQAQNLLLDALSAQSLPVDN
jgi:hypothetical protein